jgi:hypothetical protein
LISGEVDVVGIARPFCVDPALARKLLAGSSEPLPTPEQSLRLGPGVLGRASAVRTIRTLNGQAEVAWFYRQIVELSEGREPVLSLGAWSAMLGHFAREAGIVRRRSFKASKPLALAAGTESQT